MSTLSSCPSLILDPALPCSNSPTRTRIPCEPAATYTIFSSHILTAHSRTIIHRSINLDTTPTCLSHAVHLVRFPFPRALHCHSTADIIPSTHDARHPASYHTIPSCPSPITVTQHSQTQPIPSQSKATQSASSNEVTNLTSGVISPSILPRPLPPIYLTH